MALHARGAIGGEDFDQGPTEPTTSNARIPVSSGGPTITRKSGRNNLKVGGGAADWIRISMHWQWSPAPLGDTHRACSQCAVGDGAVGARSGR
jgi:hypothetical protein